MSKQDMRAHLMSSSMPPSPWQRPAFADLSQATRIACDVESHDPKLSEDGPGFIRGDAYVIGVAVAARMRDSSIWSGYFPMRHDTEASLNFEPEKVFGWLTDQMKGDQPKVAANALYDMEGTWVDAERTVGRPCKWNGAVYDVQVAEPLLDEEAFSYSLENLSRQYLGIGKTESLLHKVAPLYGVALRNPDMIKDPQKRAEAIAANELAIKRNLRKFSPRYVGPYAEDDCRLALQVLDKQQTKLENEGSGEKTLWNVFQKESRLLPLLLKMRLKGVPIDLGKAEALRDKLIADEAEMQRRLNAMTGLRIDVWKPQDIQRACDKNNVGYITTAAGNPSFTKDWLAMAGEKVSWLKLVGTIRKVSKQRRDFVESMVLGNHVKGRIHCQFHQTKKDEGGTRSGRFSSSNPNLQQVSARDQVYAPLVRGLFIAEPGCQWGAFDVKAQEPRWTVHYAYLCGFEGAAEAVAKYCADENTDYHQMVADMAGISRKAAKTINLGLAYGMGRRKLAWSLGFMTESESLDPHGPPVPPEVDEILRKYHEGVPFVKPLMDACAAQAEKNKAISTHWGRRKHFNLVELAGRKAGKDGSYERAMTVEQFMATYPGKRWVVAHTHKALNSLIQGSSADHMKQMMLDLDQAGYVPNLTVHDEIDDAGIESEKQFREIHDIMRDAVRLVVPVVLDAKLASNWAEAK
jgi:DNA polymerase I-like protein with 3'-5' exonuclease and polymerase domains